MVSLRSRFLMVAALAVVLCVAPAAHAAGRAHQRRRAGHHRRGRPGRHRHVTNQATGATQTVTTGADGSYSVTVPAGVYTVTVSPQGLRPAGAPGRRGRRRRRHRGLRARAARPRKRSRSRPCCASRAVADVPFSIAAPTEDELRAARRRRHRGRGRERGRLHRAEPGPRPEPGRDARRLRRPDRARPAGRQGAGRRLPRRLDHLPLAVHARPRPVRRRPRRGAARAAGHAVRRRLALRHRALHQQPARARRDASGSARSAAARSSGGSLGGNAKLGFNVPAGRQGRRCAWPRTTTGSPATSTPCSPTSASTRTSTPATAPGVRAALRIAPSDRFSITPRLVYQKVEMDGWNRIDAFNILANPFTTTRPAVTLGEREQFTQIEEPFTDEFLLGRPEPQLRLRQRRA